MKALSQLAFRPHTTTKNSTTPCGWFNFCSRTNTQERHRHIVSGKNKVFGAPAQGAHGEYENTQLAKFQKFIFNKFFNFGYCVSRHTCAPYMFCPAVGYCLSRGRSAFQRAKKL